MKPDPDSTSEPAEADPVTYQDDAYLMVTQLNWEDDVIWNGDDIKHKVCRRLCVC